MTKSYSNWNLKDWFNHNPVQVRNLGSLTGEAYGKPKLFSIREVLDNRVHRARLINALKVQRRM